VKDFSKGAIPAEPTIFCSAMSSGAGVPGKMNSSPAGMFFQTDCGS
jgi:hypothetical protein